MGFFGKLRKSFRKGFHHVTDFVHKAEKGFVHVVGNKHIDHAGQIIEKIGETLNTPAKLIANMTKGTKVGKIAKAVAGATGGIEKVGSFIDDFSTKMRKMDKKSRKKAALKMAKKIIKKHGGEKSRKRLSQAESVYDNLKKLRKKGRTIMGHGRTIMTAARAGQKGMTKGSLPNRLSYVSRMIGRAHVGNRRMIGSNAGNRYIQNILS